MSSNTLKTNSQLATIAHIRGPTINEAHVIAHLRRAYEAELRRGNIAVEQANIAKSDFMANMSHELRTPLNAMLGFCELIQNHIYGPPGDPRYEDYMENIHVSGQHLLRLIEDVLDLTLLDAGHLEIRRTHFAFRTWMGDCLTLVRLDADQADVALCADIADSVPEQAFADPGRLRQVVLNLVRNALCHANCRRIEVRAFKFYARQAAEERPFLQIEVVDDGDGIPADQQARLFERFAQFGSGYEKHNSGGLGLGLPICKGLAELMNGRIGVASKSGAGTRFWFNIPIGGAIA